MVQLGRKITSVMTILFGIVFVIISIQSLVTVSSFGDMGIIVIAFFPLIGLMVITMGIVQLLKGDAPKMPVNTDRTAENFSADLSYRGPGDNEPEVKTRFCPYCGTSADSGYDFCRNCGKRLQ